MSGKSHLRQNETNTLQRDSSLEKTSPEQAIWPRNRLSVQINENNCEMKNLKGKVSLGSNQIKSKTSRLSLKVR
jgi:hypothetical protein